jgi:hypothetical protein
MSKINIFYSKKKLQGTRCHKSVIFLEWCMTHCPIKYIILQPLIDVKDCTHYCGAHVQVKTMKTSCEVVLS